MAKNPKTGTTPQRPSRYARLFGGAPTTDEMSTESTAPKDETSTESTAPKDETSTESTAPKDETQAPVARRSSKFELFYKWFRRLVATVVTLAVLGAIGIGVVALVNGSWMVSPVLSGSMRPGFTVGGVVISEHVPVDQLAVRDVIVFREPSSPSTQLVHRIVKMTKSSSGQLLINTQGDANSVRDPWTLTIRGNYAYRVRWSLPLVGYVAVAYDNNRGLALLGAGLVLVALAATSVVKQRRRDTASVDLVD